MFEDPKKESSLLQNLSLAMYFEFTGLSQLVDLLLPSRSGVSCIAVFAEISLFFVFAC